MSFKIKAPYHESKDDSDKLERLTEAVNEASRICVELEEKQRYDAYILIENDYKNRQWIVTLEINFPHPSSYQWYYDAKEKKVIINGKE